MDAGVEQLIGQLAEAEKLLNEVKRYRGLFYKQKVAEWQIKNEILIKTITNVRNNNKPLPESL